jgi:hypothetical protein
MNGICGGRSRIDYSQKRVEKLIRSVANTGRQKKHAENTVVDWAVVNAGWSAMKSVDDDRWDAAPNVVEEKEYCTE